jgi:hypothetical protein
MFRFGDYEIFGAAVCQRVRRNGAQHQQTGGATDLGAQKPLRIASASLWFR